MDTFKQTFIEETYERLAELESSLLELESNPEDIDMINSVFRAMHTIKGSGGMFGFEDIVSLTHNIETLFDFIREGKIPVTKEIISRTLSACDLIRLMVDEEATDEETVRDLVNFFSELLPGDEDAGAPEIEPLISSEKETSYRIRFKPPFEIFTTGIRPGLLLNELKELGEIKIIPQTDKVPPIDEIDPETCFLYWDIFLTTSMGENAIRDVFIFIEDESEISIYEIDSEDTDCDEECKKLGEILLQKNDLSPEDLDKALSHQKRIGELLIDSKIVDHRKIEAALEEQKQIKQSREKRKNEVKLSSIRVGSEKLDSLVDLVGELVTIQARLRQYTTKDKSQELKSISEEVERLTTSLRDNAMSMRMLPIGTTFNKFKRLVRDLSESLEKDVVLTTDGGDTELDKTVIESLDDPMVHIIRNCIDHGIESPVDRENRGKNRQGKVHLSANHSGDSVVIKISDDGAGLDSEAILAKAKSKGIIGPDAELNEKEIFALIFEPGFSTAAEVTDVSGRGVGMDVVRKNLENLRGSIDIESKKGQGTKIILKLPLTLAIIDGLLVDIGRDYYVIPLSTIEKCVELTRKEADLARERNIMNYMGKAVPYLNMRDVFKIPGERPEIEKVVFNEVNGGIVGLGVDRLVGQNQIVIKKMSKVYEDIKNFSGATILGDGTVALVIDIPQIFDQHSLITH
ncbi:MAG: chemotaxis protein CheA [Desulfobacteraceae bacterium]|jgi:two-component system chemotaxis sensor kinase CheA